MVLSEWLDLDWRLPRLQELPVVLQFRAVDLHPGLNEPLLRLGQATAETLDRVDRKHRRVVLVIRVEMRPVTLPPASTNIRMTIPKNRESSGTFVP